MTPQFKKCHNCEHQWSGRSADCPNCGAKQIDMNDRRFQAACAAMTGMLAGDPANSNSYSITTYESVMMADALLAELAKHPTNQDDHHIKCDEGEK